MGDDRPDDARAGREAPDPADGPVFVRGDRVVLEDGRTGTVVEVWYAAPGGPTASGAGPTTAVSPSGEPGWLFAVWTDVPGGNPIPAPLADHVVVAPAADLSPAPGAEAA